MTTGARAVGRDLTAPPALLDEAGERFRELAATAVGRVFTVPAEGAEAAEAALRAESRSGARYDTVLSFMCTSGVTSIEEYVAAIDQVLADEGWILMVEPAGLYRRTFPRSLTARSRRPATLPRARGRDVVSALRSRGLVVTDVHRREAASVPPEWRQYMVLRARRATTRSGQP